MFIPYSTLKNNKEARDKYGNRDVKVFCGARNAWILKDGFTNDRAKAEVLKCHQWDALYFMLPDETTLVFHFVSEFDDVKPLQPDDFDREDIYNCTQLKFK